MPTVRHRINRGYGGNQKSCYAEALQRNADIIVMLHPDGQHDPQYLTSIVRAIREDGADMCLGSRFLGPLPKSMPAHKIVLNRTLTAIQNVALGLSLAEYHTGYRGFRASALRAVNFEGNSDDFIFDNQLIIQFVRAGLRIHEVPVSTRYDEFSSSIAGKAMWWYIGGCLVMTVHYTLWKMGIIRSRRYQTESPREREPNVHEQLPQR